MSSCDEPDSLTTPRNVRIEYASLTVEWGAVKNARLYTVSVKKVGSDEPAKEYLASKTRYSLSQLEVGQYEVKVKANGKEEVSSDSEWSPTVTFDREPESGLVFTLNSAGTEYMLTGKGIATGDIVIPDMYRKKPVTAIGDRAFFTKSDVTSVTFGANIKSIGEFAFSGCSYLESISEFPEGLESIGKSAFSSCRLLAGDVVIPDGVELISASAFAHCKSINSITIGDGVHTIEEKAFIDCSSLTGLYIPMSVRTIGEYAFALCCDIESLTIASGVTDIGAYAFSELVLIESVTIPNSVSSIGEGAFFLCDALATVELGNGIKSIMPGAFNATALWNSSPTNEVYVGKWFIGCKDTTVSYVNIAEGTIGIGAESLSAYKNVDAVKLPDSVKIVDYAAFAGSSFVSVEIGGGVVTLAESAFASCESLTNVILGKYNKMAENGIEYSSLTTIGDAAFYGCTALDSIYMPSTLTTVGSQAFNKTAIYESASGVVYAGNWVVGCKSGVDGTVNIREGTVGIANYSFNGNTTITSVKMTSSVKVIGRAAFYRCSALTSVELPNTLTEIRDYTFYMCKSLRLFALPTGLTYIGRSAFYKCESTALVKETDGENEVLNIPYGVEYIGDYAFYGCGYREKASLTDENYYNTYGTDVIIIPSTVTKIGNSAFYSFNSLKKIDIGGTVHIGEKAFYKCLVLEEVNFGDALVSIGDKAFYKCEELAVVNLPETLTDIGNYAFYKCISLSELTLGSVESIGNFAFLGDYNLRSLILPDMLEYLGRQAFRGCTNLTYVALGDGIDMIDEHAFYNCTDLTIYLEGEAAPEAWGTRWNSSYRPVVTGCVLSEDGSYVIYISTVEGGVLNLNQTNVVSDPVREGYTFGGWGSSSTAKTPSYTSDTISEAEAGRKLYAIWNDIENN